MQNIGKDALSLIQRLEKLDRTVFWTVLSVRFDDHAVAMYLSYLGLQGCSTILTKMPLLNLVT